MNFRWFFVLLGASFAVAGGVLWWGATRPPALPSMPEFSEGPRHPVTDEMTKQTSAKSAQLMPVMTLPTTDGDTIQVGQRKGKKPQLVYFVKEGCPCSFDAEPFFKELGRRFRNTVTFICVTNSGVSKAKDWAGRQAPPYVVAYDPEQKVIKGFSAKNSVNAVLLNEKGEVLKMWPGYSKSILLEMNSEIAKAAKLKEQPFDPTYAPDAKTSGCDFSEPNP